MDIISIILSVVPIPEINFYKKENTKDLVTVSFKCPTESVGISTPSTKCIHSAVDNILYVMNNSNVLPIDVVQVCN